ncbi:TetR/AcrR family transcriptional regulator [Paenarthrobacter sp. NPDC091669]|uniref:TetR/AcrR family transcriptional regulator n=1 Tax=Paenarthrobacter sp. NPDC091669 TaxID=3364384 RepID=UPI003813CDB9
MNISSTRALSMDSMRPQQSEPQNLSSSIGADPAPAVREREGVIRIAAVDLFFSYGYNAVGIRQIASAASINSATLYHYYASKRAILESIMEDSNQTILEAGVASVRASSGARLGFTQLAGALIAAQVSSPRTCYIIDNELRAIDREAETGQRILNLRRSYEALWQDAILAGVATGEFECEDLNVARLSLLGMYSATSLWYRPNKALSPSALCIHLVNHGLRLLQAEPLSTTESVTLVESLDFSPWECEPQRPQLLPELPAYADLLTA